MTGSEALSRLFRDVIRIVSYIVSIKPGLSKHAIHKYEDIKIACLISPGQLHLTPYRATQPVLQTFNHLPSQRLYATRKTHCPIVLMHMNTFEPHNPILTSLPLPFSPSRPFPLALLAGLPRAGLPRAGLPRPMVPASSLLTRCSGGISYSSRRMTSSSGRPSWTFWKCLRVWATDCRLLEVIMRAEWMDKMMVIRYAS